MAFPASRYAAINRSQSLEPIFRAQSLEPLCRSESLGYETQSYYLEKRQLFLRSYQFSRKQSLSERVKSSLIRAKKVVCRRLRSVRKIRKLVLSRFRYGFHCRRRRFARLLHNHNRNSSSSSYCFC